MRTDEEFRGVRTLIGQGLNDCEIARLTGIPRRTIRDWRQDRREERNGERASSYAFDMLPRDSYAYLLGLYLGDGHISRFPRT
jgi:hypothetical protein